MEEKYYGIMMNKIPLDTCVLLYNPVCLIDGTIDYESGLFVSSTGDEYFNIEDIENIACPNTTAVGYLITEEELLELYPKADLDFAKSIYLAEAKELGHLGYAVVKDENVQIKHVKIIDEFNKMNDVSYELESSFYKFWNESEEENEIECVPFMSQEDFNNLIKTDDINEIKKKLCELNEVFVDNTIEKSINDFISNTGVEENKINKKDSSNVFIVGEEISNGILLAFDDLLKSNNLKYVQKTLVYLEDLFINLALLFSNYSEFSKEAKDCEELLYDLAEDVECYSNLDKLDDIHKLLTNMLKMSLSDIKQIGVTFDKGFKAYKRDLAVKTPKEEKKESKEKIEVSSKVEEIDDLLSARKMKEYMDERVIGQEEAKRIVISSIIMNKIGDSSLNKDSCFLVGPTGSGKTLIVETLSEYLKLPYVKIDCTQLSVPGYVGRNLDEFLIQLLEQTNGDIEKAERGIVLLDEIDKKTSGKNDDVSGRGVLNTILSLVQGAEYDLTYKNKVYHLNTSRLTFFATGACTNVIKGVMENKKESNGYTECNMGFHANIKNKNDGNKQDIEYPRLKPRDFVEYGEFPDEIIGRFPNIAQLKGHTIETLKDIMVNSKNSALLEEIEKFSKLGLKLYCTDEYLDKVANVAIEKQTGARSIKSTLTESILDGRWELLFFKEEYEGMILTEESVENPEMVIMITKTGEHKLLKDLLVDRAEEALKLIENKPKSFVLKKNVLTKQV